MELILFLLENTEIETFTVGFNDKSLDETNPANDIAKRLGTKNKVINFESFFVYYFLLTINF